MLIKIKQLIELLLEMDFESAMKILKERAEKLSKQKQTKDPLKLLQEKHEKEINELKNKLNERALADEDKEQEEVSETPLNNRSELKH